jgi:catechol 2,3-dioxygenase-like lactoylglutathione lyase family enzyme
VAADGSAGGTLGPVDHVYYWTGDMDRAVAFYTEVLGLDLAYRAGDDWAELEAPPIRLALHATNDERRAASGTVVFRVGDLDETRRALERRGVAFDEHLGEVEGRARFATFRDPDGNPIQVIEYR